MDVITVNFSKWRSALILFVQLIYLIIVSSWISVSWVLIFLIVPLLFFLGWNIRRAWQELIGKRPALILDREGIVDNTRWYSLGRVEWEEVDAIKSKQLFLIANVQVIFKDTNALIKKEKNLFKKMVQWIQFIIKKTPMLFTSNLLSISNHELVTLLESIDFKNPDFVDLSTHLVD